MSDDLDDCYDKCEFRNITYQVQNDIGEWEEKIEGVCLYPTPVLTQGIITKGIILWTMVVLSLIGNIATIWNIYRRRVAQSKTRQKGLSIDRLLLHLAVADIFVTVCCIMGNAIWAFTVEWIFGNAACKILKVSQMFSLYLSTFILVLFGIDRWIAVRYPMKTLDSSKRLNRLLLGSYVLSFLFSLPQALIFSAAKTPTFDVFYQCHTHDFYTKQKWLNEQFYTTLTFIIMFIIPLVTIIATYFSTFWTISLSARINGSSAPANDKNKQIILLHNNHDDKRRRLILRAKKKSAKISLVIILAFIICWTPYYVMMMIFMFWRPCKELAAVLRSTIIAFGISNSLVNPIIYGAFHLWPSRKNGRINSHVTRPSLVPSSSANEKLVKAITLTPQTSSE